MADVYWKGGNTAWATVDNWVDSAGTALGRVPVTGENVFMLFDADASTRGPDWNAAVGATSSYCTTGPTSDVTIGNLTITIPKNVASPAILTTSATKLTVGGAFKLTEAPADAAISSGTIFGGSTAGGPVLNGNVVIIAQPPGSLTRNIRLNTAGLPLIVDITTILPYSGGAGNLVPYMPAFAGTLTINAASSPNYILTQCSPVLGAIININATARAGLTIGNMDSLAGEPWTINANAAVVFALTNSLTAFVAPVTINSTQPIMLISTTSDEFNYELLTINAGGDVTLADFTTTGGIIVNANGYVVNSVDTAGEIDIQNAGPVPVPAAVTGPFSMGM